MKIIVARKGELVGGGQFSGNLHSMRKYSWNSGVCGFPEKQFLVEVCVRDLTSRILVCEGGSVNLLPRAFAMGRGDLLPIVFNLERRKIRGGGE